MIIKISFLVIVAVSILLSFNYLIQQSKQPRGRIGVLMTRIWNRSYLPMVQWSLPFILGAKPKTVLDIGVGNGASSKLLKDTFPQAFISGIDISKDAIKHANSIFSEWDLHFAVMDVHRLNFPAETFDLITAYQTHFHWENLNKALNEIKRVLRNEGHFLLACEKNKLNYYLKDLSALADFKNFLNNIGLELLEVHQTSRWICYRIALK